MKSGKLVGLAIAFGTVVLSVYLYNKFIAKPGTTIADLGRRA